MGQATDTRDKLLDSAIELMRGRSYADVGVQELCEHARVKKGSFYHFFPSKCDLTLAALDRQWDSLRRRVFEPAFSSPMVPLQRIEQVFVLMYEGAVATKARTGRVHGCPFGNLAAELSTQDEAIRRKVNRMFAEAAGYFERGLQDAIRAGDAPRQDAAATAQALVAYLEGVLLLAKNRNDPELVKTLGQRFVRSLATASVPQRTRRRAHR